MHTQRNAGDFFRQSIVRLHCVWTELLHESSDDNRRESKSWKYIWMWQSRYGGEFALSFHTSTILLMCVCVGAHLEECRVIRFFKYFSFLHSFQRILYYLTFNVKTENRYERRKEENEIKKIQIHWSQYPHNSNYDKRFGRSVVRIPIFFFLFSLDTSHKMSILFGGFHSFPCSV